MSKNTDPVILTALMELSVDAQLETDKALSAWTEYGDRRREIVRAESEAKETYEALARRSKAARSAVETYKIATGCEEGGV
jgi:hypothetical protein